MELLHPGVYLQEVSSGVRPIEGASTSTAAFIGTAQRGPLDKALMVTNWTEFESTYGTYLSGSFLAQSALQFFNNGGRRLYIARVAKEPATATIVLGNRKTPAAGRALTLAATSAGSWSNALLFDIADASQNAGDDFKLTLKQERAGNPPTAGVLETYDNLSMNADAPNFVERVVNAKSKYVQVVANRQEVSDAHGFSQSGKGAATSLEESGAAVTGSSPPASVPRSLVINIDGDGARLISLEGSLATGATIAAAIASAVHALTPQRAGTSAAAYTGFTATFANGVYTLASGTTGRNSSVEVSDAPANNAAGLLRLGKTRGVEATGASVLRPATGSDIRLGTSIKGGDVLEVTAGSDGAQPGDVDYQKAFALLDPLRDINILAVPGISSLVSYGANYCQQRGDCFFVGDLNVIDDTKEEAQAFVNNLPVKSSYAAVYFPWVRTTDPSGASSEPIALPPSGYVAGMYARIDARRGVWKAPAGTEANLGGALGLTADISDAEQDTLNPIGVNVVRAFPATGIVLWGARTLATRSDPEYRYIPVRRTAIFLEQSIYNGIQWAVFEPNDETLWSSLRLNIGAFMMLQFRAGAFQGRSAAEAFFVQCDNKTTTQADIDAGIVNILVGFAPLKPAEFVVLRLTQKSGQQAS